MYLKTKQKNLIILLSILFFYFIIAHTAILSLDDFRWGTTIGAERFARNFDNYNGRYFGNYTILLMTRFYTAKTLIPSIVNTGIIFFIFKILNHKIDLKFILLFFFTMPLEVYRQTYGFMSGFANYNIPILLLLLIIYFIKNKSNSIFNIVLIFVSGFSVQLFLENITVVNIVLATIFFIYTLFYKKNRTKSLALLLSSYLGAYVMFSNSAYISNDTNRGLSNVNIDVILDTFITKWSELFFKQNIVLLLALVIGMIFITKNTKNHIILQIPILIAVYFFVRQKLEVNWLYIPTKISYFEGILILIFISSIFYLVYQSEILELKNKKFFFLFFILAALYSGPFLAITVNDNPFIFPRNVLTTYIFLIISILYIYIPFFEIYSSKINKKFLSYIVYSYMILFITLSSINFILNEYRIDNAKKEIQNGETIVEIQKLPFEKLFLTWNINENSNFIPQYKEFYNIPENIEIYEVPLKNKYTD